MYGHILAQADELAVASKSDENVESDWLFFPHHRNGWDFYWHVVENNGLYTGFDQVRMRAWHKILPEIYR